MMKQGMVAEKQPEDIWASLSSEEKSDLYSRIIIYPTSVYAIRPEHCPN